MLALTAVQIGVTVINSPDSANVYTSYTLSNTPFYFRPVWAADSGNEFLLYSQYQILWDFGDGTHTTGLSAQHYYKYPGVYNVTATFYNIEGNAQTINTTTDSTSGSLVYATLTAFNAMPDKIVFRGLLPEGRPGVYQLPAGKKSVPLDICRFNSWQNDSFLREDNYTINLYASGSKSDFLSPNSYYTDKYAHLRKYFGFIETYVSPSGNISTRLVDSTRTTAVSVYAERVRKENSWEIELNFVGSPNENTAFVGTTGSSLDDRTVSYIDQTPSNDDGPALIFLYAHPKTTRYYDFNQIYNDYYPSISYPSYGYINYPWAVQPLKSIFNPAETIAITSNGITVEGTQQTLGPLTGQLLHSFNIYPVKWTDTEIAFCCTFKDKDYFTTKCYPPITGFRTDGQDPTDLNTISLGVYRVVDNDPFTATNDVSSYRIDDATFVRNPDVPNYSRSGGYFAGTVTIPQETEIAYISAAALILDDPKLNLGISFGFAAQPGKSNVKRFSKRATFDNCLQEEISFSYDINCDIYTNNQTSNLGISYVPLEIYNRGQSRVYITDSDNDKIYVYSVEGALINTVDLTNAPVIRRIAESTPVFVDLRANLNSASPSNVAIDSMGNAWVTLYDAVKTIKLDYNTLTICASAEPTLQNADYSNTRLYSVLKSLSGFTGQNSLLPTCVDTDLDDNIFVGYSHPVSGYIFKYDASGTVLNVYGIDPLYSVQEIVVDRGNFTWAVFKYVGPRSPNPYESPDLIYKWDSDFNLIPGFPIQTIRGAGNLTIDLKQNLWVNSGYSLVSKITPTGGVTTFILDTTTPEEFYTQPIGGIGCDVEGYVWIIHNYNGKIYFLPTSSTTQTPLSSLFDGNLPDIEQTISDRSQAFYSVFGDWTGVRWVNKYVTETDPLPRIIRGSSNYFKILKRGPIANKVNENFDQAASFKSYILQESLFDKKMLLEEFLGQIVGNADAPPEVLGKTVYEKIANYVSNVSDPETCNIKSLKSMFIQQGLDYIDFTSDYPPGLRRTIDLLSVNKSKLFGTRAVTQYSFGLSAYDFNAGKNLGEEIDIETGTFIVGEPVVTYENFSENYKLVFNTVIPTTNNKVPVIGQPYPLSGVNYNWGWGLVTGNIEQAGLDIKPYYRFYRYKPYKNTNMVDGIIDFKNPLTILNPTLSSYGDWTGFAGGMETIIARSFYEGLEL
ncbi:MAG: hypothetical protein EBU90_06045 [Proteobacteria bacterium]|nr:hypothetical protein [Pseudomonadota bacterium]NBP13979.1 hypothetical protein [bacterium]